MASPNSATYMDSDSELLMEPVDDSSDMVEGPQPVITEMGPAPVKPEADPMSGLFEWTIERLSETTEQKLYSEIFDIGGHKWRLLVFPKEDDLPVCLPGRPGHGPPAVQLAKECELQADDLNQYDSSRNFSKDTNHSFTQRESDWGFTTFIPLEELYHPNNHYVINDSITIRCEVTVRKTLSYNYDSRAETGYVGLKNQGATCYMNSLLQTLYHIPYFRKAVYHMPTTDEDSPVKSIPLALQSLFYKIQFQPTSVSTKMLTKSFGWDTYDSFMQHDVQELNRVLCEKLEEKMKGTKVENTIQQLFEGHTWNYIECVNVEYKSTRTESFMDLQLDVKGCKDLYASFDMYTAIEMLDGQNQYKAEGHGMQDAKKGVLFENFPPVLQLQLKRFEYDFARDIMVKINDRYEFYDELDLDVGDGKYLSPNADRNVRNLYKLHSVLVHSGGVHGGHYYAFIRPNRTEWYRFDDERVTKEDSKRAMDEQFGEDDAPAHGGGFNNNLAFKLSKYSNAYMLVYIRVDDWDRIQCDVAEEEIAEHLRIRLKAEQEEKEQKRREKQEAHLYTYMKVAREEDLREQLGKSRFFDLVDHDSVKTLRVAKQSSFSDFKKQVQEEMGVPMDKQRYWLWARRQNHTFRPNRPLTLADDGGRVMDIKDNTAVKHATTDLKLLLEPLMPDGELAKLDKCDIMLFFKLYLPETQELRYAGCRFANKNDRISSLTGEMCQMAGFPPDTPLNVFEEIKFDPSVMCELVPSTSTLSGAQLEHGDIICFQRRLSQEAAVGLPYPTVKQYLDYVRNRQFVSFKPLENPKDDGLLLELSKENTYDEVCEALAAELRREKAPALHNGSFLRITAHNGYSQSPKPSPLKYRGVEHLGEMLQQYNQGDGAQGPGILYYEVLEMALPELERLKSLKIVFYNEKAVEASQHQVVLPKESCVADALEVVAKEIGGSCHAADLRLMEVFYQKIFKTFAPSERIDTINDQYWTLRAEAIPEEERNMAPDDKLIHVYHFSHDSGAATVVHNFGDPFLLVVHEGETLAQLKARIQTKLGVKDEEFASWKFAFVPISLRPEYLSDDDVVASRFTTRTSYTTGQDQSYLGLDHVDKNPKRHQQSSSYERPVKIYNSHRMGSGALQPCQGCAAAHCQASCDMQGLG
eukprot:CAMPEP_0117664232 /NCGR_PEP_ID=MMETSP0804-20121206/9096_1 /TAXON_ID=1074897 /ORGANISM="Tetraselmis astigmatica, Strain CCMP880" /LENGTH=1147 /DNA_ID=CAMNT_0005471423 /DNA_START=186 /DNA_END=3631 /DNA_ORIENTATION=+